MNNKNLVISICSVAFCATLGFFTYKPIKKNFISFNNHSSSTISNDASDYYSEWAKEDERLFASPAGILERLRTESILKRYAPKPPAVIYDIGGGTGVYSFPLAKQGYAVHLIDFTPLHIQQASEKIKKSGIKLAECSVGDARDIKADDEVADVVLLFGPLYHLQDKNDRAKALSEAHRIIKPGGLLFAVAIPRLATFLSIANKNKLVEPHATAVTKDVIEYGKDNNPIPEHKYFASAYFHNPDGFEKEIQDAGFKDVQQLNIEGPCWSFGSLKEIVNDTKTLDNLLYFLEMIENDKSILGAGAHMMAIGKK